MATYETTSLNKFINCTGKIQASSASRFCASRSLILRSQAKSLIMRRTLSTAVNGQRCYYGQMFRMRAGRTLRGSLNTMIRSFHRRFAVVLHLLCDVPRRRPAEKHNHHANEGTIDHLSRITAQVENKRTSSPIECKDRICIEHTARDRSKLQCHQPGSIVTQRTKWIHIVAETRGLRRCC